MSKFIKNIIIKKEFEGDNVTVVLRPIRFVEVMQLQPVLSNHAKLVEKLQELIKDACIRMEGLVDAGGNPVEIDDFINCVHFTALLADIGTEWLSQGVPENPL